MKKFLTGIIALLIWGLLVGTVLWGESIWFSHPPLRPGDRASLNQYLIDRLNQGKGKELGSAALALIQNGKVETVHTVRVENVDSGSPVDPENTLYQMASVSKLVTAWGVMKLVEMGQINLDDPVLSHLRRWQFPADSPYRREVTIAQLLSHTGGQNDHFGYGGFLPGQPLQTLEQSLTLTKDVAFGEPRGVEVVYPPGQEWRYSGGGYTVLQLLVEEVAGQSFAEFMREQILNPLGMTGANFDWQTIVDQGRADDLATSFTEDLQPSPPRHFTATGAASLYASLDDMVKFAQAQLRPNPVLRSDTLHSMATAQPGTDSTWGLGMMLYQTTTNGGHVIGHDGGNMPALNHTLRVNPETGNGIVLLLSGNRNLASYLGDDWVYWETGKLTTAARERFWQSRFVPALIAVGAGAIAIGILTFISQGLRRRISEH
ncbi:serine hydrolase [Synechocystis sp. PCC 7338]|uniref:serine hydrolase domain-containing protein n=1 Tax=Synechocystis sp. PCC 7338 TaxID=2732530 RepID=UPI0020129169|nr:serine hydrolase domain-containing protein [Synechocystis sp. PCC 7338]